MDASTASGISDFGVFIGVTLAFAGGIIIGLIIAHQEGIASRKAARKPLWHL